MQTIVITYGTFDLFHYGHWKLLKRASEIGDKLIVHISTDKFNKIKGKECVQSYEERVQVIKSLSFVDKVYPEVKWEQKEYNIELWEKEGLVILVMGDDWEDNDKFKDLKCTKIFLSRTPIISTTKIKEMIKNDSK